MSHTPAPWRFDNKGIEGRAFDGSWKYITRDVHGGNKADRIGNACLIAAAPELLAELKQLYLVFDDQVGFTVEYRAQVDAVLAKAEGR